MFSQVTPIAAPPPPPHNEITARHPRMFNMNGATHYITIKRGEIK